MIKKDDLQKKVTQLSLIDGLPLKEDEELKRIRLSLDAETIAKLDWLATRDKRNSQKKGNWYPKDSIKKLIDDAYHIRKNMEGEK
ncbi:hypothetical protein JZO78_04440 [Enterococcus ureilyticus]|uniref:hypothetical protein n=1 Tax=Enterococcus ureilyticus TaxID=1131292 RepID=UPI001A9125EE|nr:hypothetical protein [Enterococcus ureilyticus]MBO0445584.1 hypothetical protein [Enterococcus ureilyticus]